MTKLTLSEELLLLAVHDEKGYLIFSSTNAIQYGLSMSILIDLKKLGKISLEDNHVKILNKEKTNIEYLDIAFKMLSTKNKTKDIKFWVLTLGNNFEEIKNQLFNSLVMKGILRRDAQKLLWLIKFDRYPTMNPTPELETRDKIHKSVIMGITPDEDLSYLISLLFACSLLNEVFPKNLRSAAKKNILNIIKYNYSAKFAYDVVNDISNEMSIIKSNLIPS